MLSKRFNAFSNISLWITAFYGIINVLAVLTWKMFAENIPALVYMLCNITLTIDLFTWHVFGLFAIVSFIVKFTVFCKEKIIFQKPHFLNLIFHLIFTVSFGFSVWWLFENSF